MLRPYQEKIVAECRNLMREGCKNILIESPTGSGKTVLTSFMLQGAMKRGKSAWFNVHRLEIVEQTAKTFKRYGIPFGIISAGYEPNNELIQICSVPTLVRRTITPPDMIAWDECHHIGAKTWTTLYQKAPDAYHIGLTATPIRENGKTLGKWFKSMVHGPSIPWLMDNGYLSHYKYLAPAIPDLSDVRVIAGDYDARELGHIMQGKAIVGNVVDSWLKHANGKMTLGFAPTILCSDEYVRAFSDAGIPAAHLDGNTDRAERMQTVMKFAEGKIKVLFNCGLFGEGFDISSLIGKDVSIEAVILARPTQSLGLHKQQVGRALRPKPSSAIILDHSANFTRHGMPDDIIKWSLEDKPRRVSAAGATVAVTQCPAPCFAVFRAAAVCPYCGKEREIKERKLHYMAGELQEIKRAEVAARKEAEEKEKVKARREVGMAKTEQELIDLGVKRGYNRPDLWAAHVLNGRYKR